MSTGIGMAKTSEFFRWKSVYVVVNFFEWNEMTCQWGKVGIYWFKFHFFYRHVFFYLQKVMETVIFERVYVSAQIMKQWNFALQVHRPTTCNVHAIRSDREKYVWKKYSIWFRVKVFNVTVQTERSEIYI